MKRSPLTGLILLVLLLVAAHLPIVNGATGNPSLDNGSSPSSINEPKSTFSAEHSPSSNATSGPPKPETYQVASLKWDEVRAPFLICLWLLAAIIVKTVFHQWHFLTRLVPDSSLLLLFGIILGLAIYYIEDEHDEAILDAFSNAFFIYILPPIVFDAGYFMPNRSFFDNLGTILVYAVLGTIFNAMTIGFSLWGIGLRHIFKMDIRLLPVLTFSSIISAVDPVAVLVVFEDIHVNAMLYIVVFGESLLNDAVSVVLYEMFVSFSEIGSANVTSLDIGLGIISFFVVSLGGVGIGMVYAFVCSFLTRFTQNVRIVEPLLVLLMGYMAYLTAQMFDLSGILAIVFCGITMRQYVESNIDHKSRVSLQYMLRMLCTTAETIVFLFLGISAIRKSTWDPYFIILTILFCLVYRIIGTLVQTWVVNRFRLNKLLMVDQTIMAYGGLRGAIAYGLVTSLNSDIIPEKSIFLPTAISVILFTVFFQGMTIKPIVNFLEVKKEEHSEPAIGTLIFEKSVDDLVSAVEAVAGKKGHHWIRNKFTYINNRWIKPILISGYDPGVSGWRGDKIKRVFREINMRSALQHIEKTGSWGLVPVIQTEEKVPNGDVTDSPYATTPSIIVSSDEEKDFRYYYDDVDHDDDDEDITAESIAKLRDCLYRGTRLSRDILSDPNPMPAKPHVSSSHVSRSSSIWSGKSAASSRARHRVNRKQSSPRVGRRLTSLAANEILAGAMHPGSVYRKHLQVPQSAVSFHSYQNSRWPSAADLPAGLLAERRQTLAHAHFTEGTHGAVHGLATPTAWAHSAGLTGPQMSLGVNDARRVKSLEAKRHSEIPRPRSSHSDTDRNKLFPMKRISIAEVGKSVSVESSFFDRSPQPSPTVDYNSDYEEAYSARLAFRRRASFLSTGQPVSPPPRISVHGERLETVVEVKSSTGGGSSADTTPRNSDDTVIESESENRSVTRKKRPAPLKIPDMSQLGMEFFYAQQNDEPPLSVDQPKQEASPLELQAEHLDQYLTAPPIASAPSDIRIMGGHRNPEIDITDSSQMESDSYVVHM